MDVGFSGPNRLPPQMSSYAADAYGRQGGRDEENIEMRFWKKLKASHRTPCTSAVLAAFPRASRGFVAMEKSFP